MGHHRSLRDGSYSTTIRIVLFYFSSARPRRPPPAQDISGSRLLGQQRRIFRDQFRQPFGQCVAGNQDFVGVERAREEKTLHVNVLTLTQKAKLFAALDALDSHFEIERT